MYNIGIHVKHPGMFFWGGRGQFSWLLKIQIQSAKFWPNFFLVGGGGGGGGVFLATQNSSVKFWPNPFRGRGENNEPKILQAQASYCITDSLSHTTCVETNKVYFNLLSKLKI